MDITKVVEESDSETGINIKSSITIPWELMMSAEDYAPQALTKVLTRLQGRIRRKAAQAIRENQRNALLRDIRDACRLLRQKNPTIGFVAVRLGYGSREDLDSAARALRRLCGQLFPDLAGLPPRQRWQIILERSRDATEFQVIGGTGKRDKKPGACY